MDKRVLMVLVLAAGCQSDDPPPAPQAEAHEGVVVDPADRAILDAALADILANPELADTRAFYGSGGTTVLYDLATFPPGYVPTVPGYQFAVMPPRLKVAYDAPRALTVDLRWFRGRPTLPPQPGEDPLEANRAYRDRHRDWQGVELCVFNGGGGGKERVLPIGGCSVYYDVRFDAGLWKVTFKGAEDP
jgi:hypothetical protein